MSLIWKAKMYNHLFLNWKHDLSPNFGDVKGNLNIYKCFLLTFSIKRHLQISDISS